MTGPENTGPEEGEPPLDEVRKHQVRCAALLRGGNALVAVRLAQIGVLGWIIVAPMIGCPMMGCVFLGRWLDGHLDTGNFCTAPLLMTWPRRLVRVVLDGQRMSDVVKSALWRADGGIIGLICFRMVGHSADLIVSERRGGSHCLTDLPTDR